MARNINITLFTATDGKKWLQFLPEDTVLPMQLGQGNSFSDTVAVGKITNIHRVGAANKNDNVIITLVDRPPIGLNVRTVNSVDGVLITASSTNADLLGALLMLIDAGAVAPLFDADAQAFITAAAIVDVVQQNAINQLVLDLKAASIWTKMKAIYPMVGGTAAQHKFNLKDPRDLNAAFRLNFMGGWLHSVGGAQPNGINSYAQTFFEPDLEQTLTNGHISYYSRNNSSGSIVMMGAYSNASTNLTYIAPNVAGDFYAGVASPYASWGAIGLSTEAHVIVQRLDSALCNCVINGSVLITPNTNGAGEIPLASSALSPVELYLGALNHNGVPVNYGDFECAFASMGDTLTNPEALDFYTAIQTFQTALSREV